MCKRGGKGPPSGGLLLFEKIFGSLYTDEDFGALFPSRDQPAEAPARLALITMMQFVEGLSDRPQSN